MNPIDQNEEIVNTRVHNHPYAAKYLPYIPTEEELHHKIEQQKQFFLEQHNKD